MVTDGLSIGSWVFFFSMIYGISLYGIVLLGKSAITNKSFQEKAKPYS